MAYSTIARPRAYFSSLWSYRTFVFSLARLELLNRFRRSYMGVLWAMIQPFMLTLMLSLVLQYVTRQPFHVYSVHVFTGVVVWEMFSQVALATSSSILGASAFIRQTRIPIIVYPLKSFMAICVTFCAGLVSCLIWIAVVSPESVSVYWLLTPLSILLVVISLAPLAIIAGILGLLFRDYQQTAQLALLSLYFLSPVFLDTATFQQPPLHYWDAINPISNMLHIVRYPLLKHSAGFLSAYIVVCVFAGLLYLCAYVLLKRNEERLVYYL